MKQHASLKLYVYSLSYVFAPPSKINGIGKFFSVTVEKKKKKNGTEFYSADKKICKYIIYIKL